MSWQPGGQCWAQYWGHQNPGTVAFNHSENCERLHTWGSKEELQEVSNPPPLSRSPEQNSTDSLDDVLCVIEEMWAQEMEEDKTRAQQSGGQSGGQQNPDPIVFNDGEYGALTIEELNLNAFTLFMKQNRASAEAELGLKSSAVVEELLSERWRSLSPDHRELYVGEAKVDAILYAMQNPY